MASVAPRHAQKLTVPLDWADNRQVLSKDGVIVQVSFPGTDKSEMRAASLGPSGAFRIGFRPGGFTDSPAPDAKSPILAAKIAL
jgi:hypothetical protein